jgi:hypothetical protein
MATKNSTAKAVKESESTVFGFKATDKDLQCKGFQFTPGQWHDHKGDVELCRSGFHFCENPLDVFKYYPPAQSRFHEIEARSASPATLDDSKRVSQSIKIGAEIGIAGIAKAFVEYRMARVKPAEGVGIADGAGELATSSGYASAATSSGYASAATSSGNRSAATSSGNRSAATVTGENSKATANDPQAIAHADGINSRARGQLGAWLTLSEWSYDQQNSEWDRINVQAVRVDGKTIKADTYYQLTAGEVKESS